MMDTSTKRILAVEDDSSLRKMLELVYRDEGYQIDTAADGSEAFELFQQSSYDLIVTDLYMPNMNGFELISHCLSRNPTVKTILLSGGGKDLVAEHGQKIIQLAGQELTVDLFLKKPCELAELLTATAKLLS